MFNFQLFKVLGSTSSRLHQRVQLSFKTPAIASGQFLKSVRVGNLYLGPLEMIERILESDVIFQFPVII